MVVLPRISQKEGFTLIELMVVVAIIGILMASGILAFSGAQRNARDAKRIADLHAIGTALEQYYADNNGVYPTSLANSTNNMLVQNFIGQYFPTESAPISNGNTNPQEIGTYYVNTNATGSRYCVYMRIYFGSSGLENTSRLNCTGSSAGVCTFTTSSPTTYCVQNRQ